ncbi:hypothetical protein [Brevundimonas faecalis]|uniref:Uncharacterized protein n=1 Tax=Brevundimonas faecalis TaxID=947378 RepID=A0ABV2R7E9_9CAUL
MIQNKTLLRSQAGVRLHRIEDLATRQRQILFRVSTHREVQPKLYPDEAMANRAFAREVAASLEDPVVRGLIARGDLSPS